MSRRSLLAFIALTASLACVPGPSGDEYRRALQDPVWNREPIDADALATQFWDSPAASIKAYARKVVRVRGVVVAVTEAPATQYGQRWSVLLQSENRRSSVAGVSCVVETPEDVAKVRKGTVAIVHGAPRAQVPAMALESCVVEQVGAGGPPAVAPAAATVDPGYVEEVAVAAEELDRAYASDRAAAVARFGGKPLLVTGSLAGTGNVKLALAGSAFRTVACMDLWPAPLDYKGIRATVRAKVRDDGLLGLTLWACRRVTE